jgi:hypothetical protein
MLTFSEEVNEEWKHKYDARREVSETFLIDIHGPRPVSDRGA